MPDFNVPAPAQRAQPIMKTYDVIACPLCDYLTGVHNWSYGKENAQGALASHLHRKKHGLSRAEARTLAKAQPVMECEYDGGYQRHTLREKTQGAQRAQP